MESECKQPIKIYGNDALSSRVAAFQKKAEEHHEKQKSNPFSQSGSVGSLNRPKWDKSDPSYGRPPAGSKTEQRGQAAGALISNEVLFLCEMINEYGTPGEDGTVSITFGELFQIYTTISNKVVGILMRARKHGLLHFEGEMLFQRRDDDVAITLLRPLKELKAEFGPKPPPKRKHDSGDEPLPIDPEDY